MPESGLKTGKVPENYSIVCSDLTFSYEENREILHNIYMEFPKGSFTSIVGESGCEKSTIAAILIGEIRHIRI